MDLPTLHLESPKPWVQLALDSLQSPSAAAPGSPGELQRLATKHWRKVRANVFASAFISELQKSSKTNLSQDSLEEEGGEEYNIYASSEPSVPSSPGSPKESNFHLLQNHHLLQNQLQEASEEIERLYSEKEDVEQRLQQMRRSSMQVSEPEIAEKVSVGCQCNRHMQECHSVNQNAPLSPPSPLSRKPKESRESREMLEAEAKAIAWEVERHSEERELQWELREALSEVQAAQERREPST